MDTDRQDRHLQAQDLLVMIINRVTLVDWAAEMFASIDIPRANKIWWAFVFYWIGCAGKRFSSDRIEIGSKASSASSCDKMQQ